MHHKIVPLQLAEKDKPQRQIVKAEANLLRLPIFSLYAQELKDLDGIECRGRITRSGQVYQYRFEASRNVKTLYPGPLARSVHLAFLSIITDKGLPTANPVTWSWRELCRRMGVECSGQMVRRIKEAIRSTVGLMLYSQDALFSKVDQEPIRTGETALHLYEKVAFVKDKLPTGDVADTNYLWISDWYLANLNSLFTAPLDYELWRHLDRKSPIASRLYEFLLLKFYSGVPVLRINYANLVPLLPLRPERYYSQAKRQLEPSLHYLIESRVLDRESSWAKNKEGLLQLQLCRGNRLLPVKKQGLLDRDFPVDEISEVLEVKELRNIKPPEWSVVSNFYRLWSDETNPRPSAKELEQARSLLQEYGETKTRALIPMVVKHMKMKWPDAKTFGAVCKYIPDAVGEYEKEQQRIIWERQEAERRKKEVEERELRKQRDEELASLWSKLPADQRAVIERKVLASYPHLKPGSHFLHMMCLAELADRLETAEQAPANAAGVVPQKTG